MAEALKEFKEGEDILASEINDNYQFLFSKLSDNADRVDKYVKGEVATIKSNVSSVQATLQNNLDDYKNEIKEGIGRATSYVIETFVDGTSWYRIYSDGWIEQGGRGHGSVTLKKPYSNANYCLTVTHLSGAIRTRNTQITSITATGFSVYSEDSWTWFTCGY